MAPMHVFQPYDVQDVAWYKTVVNLALASVCIMRGPVTGFPVCTTIVGFAASSPNSWMIVLTRSVPSGQPYQEKNAPKGFDPLRNRRLLLTKAEVLIFTGIEQQNGLTIVPISMYNSGRSIKVALGIVKGKKKFDKRQDLKKRADKRHIERTLKYE
jgi:hypothetical protein